MSFRCTTPYQRQQDFRRPPEAHQAARLGSPQRARVARDPSDHGDGDHGNYVFRAGAFVEDARGRWYFCVNVAVEIATGHSGDAHGIDLGLKDIATCSDETRLEPGRWYRKTQEAVGRAQRARKPKRVAALHAKAKNQRRDALHKFSRSLD